MDKIKTTAGWKIILYLLAFIAIFIIAAIISELLTGWIGHPAVKVAVREIVIKIPLTLAGFHIFARRVARISREDVYLGGFSGRIFTWLLAGFAITAVVFFAIVFTMHPEVYERLKDLPSRTVSYYITATFALALSAAVLEETLFRGYFLGLIEKRWNAVAAIVAPAVLFGLLHLTSLSSFNLTDVLLLFAGGTLAGIMFGMIAWTSGRVYASSMVHFAWNTIFSGKIIMFGLASAEEMRGLYYFQLDPLAGNWMTGGHFGVEVSLPAMLVYTAVILIMLNRYKRVKGELIAGA